MSSLSDHIASAAGATPSGISSTLPTVAIDTLAGDENAAQTSSAVGKKAPRFIAILLFVAFLLLNLSGVAAVDDSMAEDYDSGITFTDEDQAPECLESCTALSKYASGSPPQVVGLITVCCMISRQL